jgi:hypothetical protein
MKVKELFMPSLAEFGLQILEEGQVQALLRRFYPSVI